ncbi:MAG: hypothetical protein Q8Q38_02770 [bacterium]|nr:hypothetical protein [bacterium]
MKLFSRIQNLSESRRKMILWSVVALTAIGLLGRWISRILDAIDRI